LIRGINKEKNLMNKFWVITISVVTLIALVFVYTIWANPGRALVGPVWVATRLNGHKLLPATTISAEFDSEGSVSGSSGCNNYSTSYTVDGDGISFGEEIISTMKLCDEPVNEQESEYLQVLNEVEAFNIKDEELTLLNGNGNTLAVYMAQSQALEGTSWDVIYYNNGRGGVTSLVIDTEITANFGEDGKLTGGSGCNSYSAAYESEDGNISIGPSAVTLKFCAEPEGTMEQESEYLAALQTAATYKVEGNSMNMRTADGATVANFIRISE
jgi:heat shock protein HslJ